MIDDDPRSLHHEFVLFGLIGLGAVAGFACLTFAALSIWALTVAQPQPPKVKSEMTAIPPDEPYDGSPILSAAPGPRWAPGILALVVAVEAIGALGWMLWPRYTLPPGVTVEPLRFRQSPQIILRLASIPASAASAIIVPPGRSRA